MSNHSMHPKLAVKTALMCFLAFTAIWLTGCSGPDPKAQDLLAQIHTAFMAYAEDSHGLYPLVSAQNGEFLPDMDAFGPYLARLPEGDLLSAYITGKCGVQMCYLGYLIPSQLMALALLDEYEKCGAGSLRRGDVQLSDPGVPARNWWRVEPESWRVIYRLREGMERFLFTGNGNPMIDRATLGLPVLWEMSDPSQAPGGWVLYMDGHTEWLPYGAFPITEKLLIRLQDFMPVPTAGGALQTVRVDRSPPLEYSHMQQGPSPVHQIAADLVDALHPPAYSLAVQCDITPSVQIGRHKGYRIRLPRYVEVVLFPDDIEVDGEFKERIWPDYYDDKRSPVDMGAGHGYRWFAYATIWQQDNFRQDFGLTGGDDRFQLMIDSNAFYLMSRLGEKAVPYLQSIVTDADPTHRYACALMALDQIECAQAADLVRAEFAIDNEHAFRNAEAVTEATMGTRPYMLNDSTVDMIAEVFLRHEAREQLVDRAARYATVTGMMDTSKINRIGLAILKRLPRSLVERKIESFREVSGWQAERLERALWANRT